MVVNVTGNTLDGGAYLNNGNMAQPWNPNYTSVLINEGIEINGPVSNCTFSGNTIQNHGVSGYWLGGTGSGIVLSNETVTYNKIHGIQVISQPNVEGVQIKGGSSSNNGGWSWYNGSSDPTGYGLLSRTARLTAPASRPTLP
jgi:hypothetical protein